ncbi:MAG: primase-helicase family protein, partial [Plesiomonas shigelloides]
MTRYVWVEQAKAAFDMWGRVLIDEQQFSVRHNMHGNPSGKNSAWKKWLADAERLQRADAITYVPGGDPVIGSKNEGMQVNTWRPTELAIPKTVFAEQVEPWIAHWEAIYPKDDLEILFDWFAFLLQRQNEKPRFAVILGSTHEGVGKDLGLRPIIEALGPHNCKTVNSDTFTSLYTDWAENARLVIAQEMQQSGKLDIANKLKIYLSNPPHSVPVHKKFKSVYEVPNIFGVVFLTNEPAAIKISAQDRRYFVLWSDVTPHPSQHYLKLVDWYNQGGHAKVAAWLMNRDLSRLEVMTRAPLTEAKVSMQEATRSQWEDYIATGIQDYLRPFNSDLVTLADVYNGAE